MTIGTGPLLRSGNRKDFKALGEEGNPVYKWATQIRVAIRRKIGADSTGIFALPQVNEDGDILDWYAPEPGLVVPWTAATRAERLSAKAQLADIQQTLLAAEREANNSEDKDQSVFKRLLVHVIQFPDDEHVYLVNGKPVLTFWGFVEADAAPRSDPLSVLTIPDLPVEGQIISQPAQIAEVQPEAIPVRRRFSWWWLLLIPLLLLLLFFLLRGCSDLQQFPVLQDLVQLDGDGVPEVTTDIDNDRSYSSDGVVDRNFGIGSGVPGTGTTGSADIPGAADAQPGVEDTADPEAGQDESATDEQQPANPEEEQQAEDPTTDQQPENSPEDQQTDEDSKEQPPETPQEQPENNTEDSVPPPEIDSNSPNAPQQPLAIPPDPALQQSMDFLNGRWQANAGLMDEQGRPVNLEYDFKDGKGNVRIKKNDGTVCTGPVEASMSDAKLSFSDKGKIKCPDGKSFQPAKVQCTINASNKTVCAGAYKDGNSFKMDISKSEKNQ
jgi:hypothetical protein